MKRIQLPLSEEVIMELHVGEQVLLSGVLYTGRDAAHKRLIQMIENHQELPFDIKNQTIYYVGPTPCKDNEIFGSGGPTTSGRMDAYTPTLLDLGLKGMIGKGKRSVIVKDAIRRNHCVYFGAIGGAGAYIKQCIKSCEVIAFDDLGPEAIRKLEVKDFPVTVIIDAYGNDWYSQGRREYLKGKNYASQ